MEVFLCHQFCSDIPKIEIFLLPSASAFSLFIQVLQMDSTFRCIALYLYIDNEAINLSFSFQLENENLTFITSSNETVLSLKIKISFSIELIFPLSCLLSFPKFLDATSNFFFSSSKHFSVS